MWKSVWGRFALAERAVYGMDTNQSDFQYWYCSIYRSRIAIWYTISHISYYSLETDIKFWFFIHFSSKLKKNQSDLVFVMILLRILLSEIQHWCWYFSKKKIKIDMDIGNIFICIPGWWTFCHTNFTYKSVISVFLKIVLKLNVRHAWTKSQTNICNDFCVCLVIKNRILSYFLAKLKYVEILH